MSEIVRIGVHDSFPTVDSHGQPLCCWVQLVEFKFDKIGEWIPYFLITFGLPSPSHENDALRIQMAFLSEKI